MSDKTTRLDLNPGAPRRKARSGCRCLFWVGCLISVLVAGLIFYLIGVFLTAFVTAIRFPHEAMYQNSTLLKPPPGSVVRPLIDAQQSFDIAVTVWVRATVEVEEKYRKSLLKEVNLDTEVQQGTKWTEEDVLVPTAMDVGDGRRSMVKVGMDELIKGEDVLETPLYSDIAFRGLRLSEKGVSTAINFRLPTARFLGANLTSSDVRASFVLIPSSPSPIDYLKNYSSWIPNSIKVPPTRPWPFPLGSPEHGNRTLVDEALDSFGVSTPLIEFHEIQSRCLNSTGQKDDDKVEDVSDTKTGDDNDNKTDGDNDDEDEDDKTGNLEPKGSERDNKVVTALHKLHPHVVTRTQLRIVDETSLFNRKAYNKAHKLLKTTSCGQKSKSARPHRHLCTRNYITNGNWETLLQLEMPLPGNEAETEVQWTYAPYLSTPKPGASAGPLDVISVPVNRENCTTTNSNNGEASSEVAGLDLYPVEEQFMNVTLRISISGRSYGKLLLTDTVSWPHRIKYNASEYEKTTAQITAELFNGIHGHKFHDDAHPRRRLLVMLFNYTGRLLLLILNMHYWYTRVSTVSISIPGTVFLVLRPVLETVDGPRSAAAESDSSIGLASFIFMLIVLPQPLLMIKAITRAELGWWKGTTWIPVVRRAMATHKERASMRLDARTSWRVKGVFFLSLVGIYYLLAPDKYLIIPSLLPERTPDSVSESGHRALLKFNQLLKAPTKLTGICLQLLLNHRSRTFAGWHKSAGALWFMLHVTAFANFVPAVFGRIDVRDGVSAEVVVYLVLLVVMAWQALTLPSVPQTGGDEDEE